MEADVTTRQFVILSREDARGTELPAIGPRDDIVRSLGVRNTIPERDGEDILFGPGITIELPPGADPITQMLISVTEEEIAWLVITRLVRELNWKLLDPATGREYCGE